MKIPIKTVFLMLTALIAPAIAKESGALFKSPCGDTLTCRTRVL
ncbi:hypothetical protein [Erwinia sp.]|nr:hypothetical protein [Erwinia sp.]